MGWKIDLSPLTKDEAQHVLKVVRRDMKLRKKEETRLSDLTHELQEEGAHCLLLAKQHGFNKQCCIRCCGPFSFIIKPRHVCLYCHYNVCKACCFYSICNSTRNRKGTTASWDPSGGFQMASCV
ncbi:Rab effector MyRIP [Bagarius yarrelli]|uniref:Rab effector MyRIP n=1 Tax=Bagarius yarrelli TaxID=175774 RepID=A0A556VVA3_BAGYA|nr:Rab effector MyRIP [Bagarius yarrelli]